MKLTARFVPNPIRLSLAHTHKSRHSSKHPAKIVMCARLSATKLEDVMFENNEGLVDRIVRIGLGLGLISLAFVGPATPFGWLGLVPLVTGIVGTCPLYRLIGFRTNSASKAA